MAQFARPVADELITSWADQAAGTTNIFNSIDETVRNDSDYVVTANNDVVARWTLTTLTDPQSSSNHFLRAAFTSLALGASMTIRITQGNGASVRATRTYLFSEVSADEALTAGEADSIDWTQQLEMEAVVTGLGKGEDGKLTWFELEVPDAPAGGSGLPPSAICMMGAGIN